MAITIAQPDVPVHPRQQLAPINPSAQQPTYTSRFFDSPVVESPSSPTKISFPKVAIPTSGSSTESEVFSDAPPSLLTSLFCRQNSATSTLDQCTPITPADCASKPILRRPDCTSTSTSASEDFGAAHLGNDYGLDRSSSVKIAPQPPALGHRRSTLTFAVKCATSDTCQSLGRPTQFARSPAAVPAWCDDDYDDDEENENDNENEEEEEEEDGRHIMSPLFEEASDSEDEGYEEDQEGGFTDDEDMLGTFCTSQWVASDRWKACQADVRRRAEEEESTTRTNSPSPIFRSRGRKVSIATSKPDHCSRHLSPPPSRATSPTSKSTKPAKSSCPPAASSPSAIGLCRRRETRDGSSSRIGWRSDDAAWGMGDKSCSFLHRPPPTRSTTSICPSRSILRNASEGGNERVRVAEEGSNISASRIPLQRRVSAPVDGQLSSLLARCAVDASPNAYARRGSGQ